jgi:hypothetical protein
MRATRAAIACAFFPFAIAAPQAASASPHDPALGKIWADFGLGYGYMSGGTSAPADSDGGGVWLDARLGGRLSSEWLVGFNLSGAGIHAASRNFDPNNIYSSIYGQSVTNMFLVARFEPQSDHGWWFGGGAGKVLYDNKSLEAVSGNQRSGNGNGGIARVGYDWPLKNRTHVEASLSYELGNISLNAPFTGSFHYSVIALAAHFSYH